MVDLPISSRVSDIKMMVLTSASALASCDKSENILSKHVEQAIRKVADRSFSTEKQSDSIETINNIFYTDEPRNDTLNHLASLPFTFSELSTEELGELDKQVYYTNSRYSGKGKGKGKGRSS